MYKILQTGDKMKKKNTTLSEQFQNSIEKNDMSDNSAWLNITLR